MITRLLVTAGRAPSEDPANFATERLVGWIALAVLVLLTLVCLARAAWQRFKSSTACGDPTCPLCKGRSVTLHEAVGYELRSRGGRR